MHLVYKWTNQVLIKRRKKATNERNGRQSASCLARCGLSDRTKIGGNRSKTSSPALSQCNNAPWHTQWTLHQFNLIIWINIVCSQWNTLILFIKTLTRHNQLIIHDHMKAEDTTVFLQNFSSQKCVFFLLVQYTNSTFDMSFPPYP